jgi:hypothetical protein
VIVDISTPALMFPAVSLLFLAYTNRFMATGQLARNLGANIKNGTSNSIREQVRNLKLRMLLIKWTQITGAGSLLLTTLSMILIFLDYKVFGSNVFLTSLVFLLSSLIISIYETSISTDAIFLELKGIPLKKEKEN